MNWPLFASRLTQIPSTAEDVSILRVCPIIRLAGSFRWGLVSNSGFFIARIYYKLRKNTAIFMRPLTERKGKVEDKWTPLLSTLMALQAGLPPLDFSELQGAKREEYFAAVRAGMDRNYQPMERIFTEVIEWTLTAC